jgi:hypothetical protein
MSRRSFARQSNKRADKKPGALPAQPREPLLLRGVRSLLGLPRLVRIAIAALFALTVTVALGPIIDNIYLQFFFSDATRLLPTLAAAGVGLVMYVLGWMLLVGTVGEAGSVRWAVIWYLVIGLLSICLIITQVVLGFTIINTPT